MKRIITFILISIGFTQIPPNSYAHLVIDNVTGYQGDTIIVDINIELIEASEGFNFTFNFDQNIIELFDVQPLEVVPENWTISFQNQTVVGFDLTMSCIQTGGGFLRLYFVGLNTGITPICFSNLVVGCCQGGRCQPLPNSFECGSVTILEESENCTIPSDTNNDGIVNVLDILSIICFPMDPPIGGCDPECFDSADLNGDGSVNVLDIVMIVNIILGN